MQRQKARESSGRSYTMTKTELLNLPNDEKNIIQLENRLKALKTRLYSPQEPNFNEKIKETGKPAGALVDAVIDLENLIESRKAELKAKKETAGRIFKRLDPEHRAIMTLYYIEGLTWPAVADLMILTPAALFRKRKEAIETLLQKPVKAGGQTDTAEKARKRSGSTNTAAEC